MTEGEQKLSYIEEQIRAAKTTTSDDIVITCPYCGAENTSGQGALCCEKMVDAVLAVCERLAFERDKRQTEMVMEAVYKHTRN